jgi:hypothetical protein
MAGTSEPATWLTYAENRILHGSTQLNRRVLLLFAVTFLSAHLSAQACEPRQGRQVRVEGAVTAVQQDRIEIGVGRRPETLLLTERTRILRRGSDVDASILKSGDRIFVQGVRLGSGQIEAREIRLGGRGEGVPSGDAPASGGHKH